MRKFTILLALMAFLGVNAAIAQKTITGTVTSAEDGQAIPGVQVVVKGTTVGTTTDIDGNYDLSVNEQAEILVFKFVGMATKEVEIGDKEVINVTLESRAMDIEGVVVTALGISREKKSLGYAVSEVQGDDINRTEKENVIEGLSGKISGVRIKANTNMGGSSDVIIRGQSSLTGNNQALFVVDGVPINNMNSNTAYQKVGGAGFDYGNPISDLNPNDIKSMTVLKGAAATALYGSRAANGVIVIETKKGDKPSEGYKSINVNMNSTTTMSTMDKSTFPEYQDQYGAGYGPYYSGSDIPYLYNYDFDGDGDSDYVVPSTEDASRGAAFDEDLMVYDWTSFYPESPYYNEKRPFDAADNGPEYFFGTGMSYTNNISVSGGTEYSTFRLSYTNTDKTGMMPNSERKKNNLAFNSSYDILDNLKVSASVNYTNTYTKGRNRTGYSDNILSSFRQWWNVGVDMKNQKELYELNESNLTWNPNSEEDLSPIYWDNFYFQRYQSYQDDERDRVYGNVNAQWQINDDLSVNAQYSLDQYNFIQQERKAVGSVAGAFGIGYPSITSGYQRTDIFFSEQNFDAQLKYDKDISEDFDMTAMLGTNIRRSSFERIRESTNGGLAVPGTFALNNSSTPRLPPVEELDKIGVNGIFANFSLGYKDMLFLDGSVRRDVSSTLPIDDNSYVYPSLSFAFLFNEVLDEMDWLDLGKVRVNWAQVGSDAPWGRILDSYRVVSPFGSSTLARIPASKNNPDLKPEISSSFEAGLEFAMFQNRLFGDVAVFQEKIENQIIPLALSTATGYESKLVNVGQVDKDGIELHIGGRPVQSKNFKWQVDMNWSTVETVVADLGGDIENLQLGSMQGGVTINAREGEPYGAIQGTDFEYSPDGRRIVNPSGYYAVTGTSDKVIGNIQPDWNAGVTNTFNYKNFALSFLIDVQMGGSIFSLDQWYGMATGLYPETTEINDLGNQERDPILTDEDGNYTDESGGIVLDGVVPVDNNDDGEPDEYVENTTRIAGDNYAADGYATSPNARYVFDATFVKLRELSLSYTLPQKVAGNIFDQVKLSLIGSNLAILYKDLPYADPEASQSSGNIQGWQSGVFPTTRNIGLRVNIQF